MEKNIFYDLNSIPRALKKKLSHSSAVAHARIRESLGPRLLDHDNFPRPHNFWSRKRSTAFSWVHFCEAKNHLSKNRAITAEQSDMFFVRYGEDFKKNLWKQ